MKRLSTYMYICIMAMLVMTACTSDMLPEGGATDKDESATPLCIRVDGFVSMTTRAALADMPGGTLSSDTRLGVFVMYERDYDSLAIGSYYRNISYSYDNVECSIDNAGNLYPANGEPLFYPMGSDVRIAVFAYAPYDSSMTREKLFAPKGEVGVDCDQHHEAVIASNDFLFGTPVFGNPFSKPHNNIGSMPADIRLNLRHQRSRIVLDFTLRELLELLDTVPFAHVDSFSVIAENVPVEAPVGYSLDSSLTNFAHPDSVRRDSVRLGAFMATEELNTLDTRYTSVGIVIPCAEPADMSFKFILMSGTDSHEVRLHAQTPVAFERGTSVMFRINTEDNDDSNPDVDEIPIDPDGSNPAAARKCRLCL